MGMNEKMAEVSLGFEFSEGRKSLVTNASLGEVRV